MQFKDIINENWNRCVAQVLSGGLCQRSPVLAYSPASFTDCLKPTQAAWYPGCWPLPLLSLGHFKLFLTQTPKYQPA